MTAGTLLADTQRQMLREQLPNLFRLYLNPFVAQACYCLERYVQTTWSGAVDEYQSFLANSFDEALSGAIKLARYCGSLDGRPGTGLLIDPADRLGPFVGARAAGGAWVEFLPGLVVARSAEELRAIAATEQRFGFVVMWVSMPIQTKPCQDWHADPQLQAILHRDDPLVIQCDDTDSRAVLRKYATGVTRGPVPDIVIFDETFVNRDVPFGAFTARRALYDHWNRPGKTTFHSTTYQPNTISALHFMKCLEHGDPTFYASIAPELGRMLSDLDARSAAFARLYSPSLAKMIRSTGFQTADIRAEGHFVHVGDRKVLDCVGGVACSIRGHNPPGYAEEIEQLGDAAACRAELAARLAELTGLAGLLPAVSGASAVENALKLALVAQFPRRHVLALKSGFGGKTLFALTGTWGTAYKENIGPLYADVLYIDPFAADAIAQIEKVLAMHEVAVVQVELVQGVGGVRRVPETVIRYLQERRRNAGFLLLVDEVQTGMYRTGPFLLSAAAGVSPDLLVFGKGASDMMFPFALLLYSAAVRDRLAQVHSDLPAQFEQRYGYAAGYRTVLNVLRRADDMALTARVVEAGALFEKTLRDGLAGCEAVRDIRVHGMLLGIELETKRWPHRWFRKKLFQVYLLAMLRHPRYPVLVGFCQYEPNVLKITPPLTIRHEEIRAVCATIIEVLRRPFFSLLGTALGGLVRSLGIWSRKHEHVTVSAHEPCPR